MDGVPGLSFAGIAPGKTFVYRIPVVQNGTYWYHSHSGSQEQVGLIGALVIEPWDHETGQSYGTRYIYLVARGVHQPGHNTGHFGGHCNH
jgi:FtsP/CotA-like multicopper oxidase with cupredoxin domain